MKSIGTNEYGSESCIQPESWPATQDRGKLCVSKGLPFSCVLCDLPAYLKIWHEVPTRPQISALILNYWLCSWIMACHRAEIGKKNPTKDFCETLLCFRVFLVKFLTWIFFLISVLRDAPIQNSIDCYRSLQIIYLFVYVYLHGKLFFYVTSSRENEFASKWVAHCIQSSLSTWRSYISDKIMIYGLPRQGRLQPRPGTMNHVWAFARFCGLVCAGP